MKKLDSIALTSIAAEKAGMSYGKYVALFGVVNEPGAEVIPKEGARICPECGKFFWGRKGRVKYCSSECQVKSGERKYRERREEKLGSMERICIVCGEPIPENRSALAKTCSEECSEQQHLNNKKICERRRRNNMGTQPLLEPRTCPVCGAEFVPAVHNQRCCSSECYLQVNNMRSKNRKRRMKDAEYSHTHGPVDP